MVPCFRCKRNQNSEERGKNFVIFVFKTLSIAINLIHCKCRYGIQLAQALTKKVIERGYTPFVVIRPENDASRNLYTKLGFKRAFATVRVTLVPNRDDGIKANYMNGHHLNGHNANEEIDTQKDEGIEDMRAEIPESINQNPVDVAKDEGIDDEDV